MNKKAEQYSDSLPEKHHMTDIRTELKKILVKEFSERLTQKAELTEKQCQSLSELILSEKITTMDILRVLHSEE